MSEDEPSAVERAPQPTRRRILRGAATASVGAVAGAALAGAPAAHAVQGATLTPVEMGQVNDAGSGATVLRSTTSSYVFSIVAHGTSTTGLRASTSSTGSAIVAQGNNTTSSAPVVQATASGPGFALYGVARGAGRAIAGYVAVPSSSASAVYGATAGTGAGIEGKSDNGRGGKFTGRFAQINLAPGTSTTHPSHGGILGDLYVDLNARLWFCRGANNWVQVV